MTVSFTLEEVLNAIYVGILNRAPDPSGATDISNRLTAEPAALAEVISNFVSSPERFSVDRYQGQTLRALYRAALGREPDQAGIASYAPWVQTDFYTGVIRVADSLFNSAEYQDRVLPVNLDRVLVDHSPHGELRAIIRELSPRGGAATLIVEVGVDDPGMTISLDLLKILDWRAVLLDPAPKRKVAIESRFSGTNYRLIEAAILRRNPLAALAEDEQAYRQAKRVEELGLLDAQPPLVSLSEVLETAEVPHEFGILAIGFAPNTTEVLNELIELDQFKPSIIVLMTPIPKDFTHIKQLGLGDAVAASYEAASTTTGSIMLLRKGKKRGPESS